MDPWVNTPSQHEWAANLKGAIADIRADDQWAATGIGIRAIDGARISLARWGYCERTDCHGRHAVPSAHT